MDASESPLSTSPSPPSSFSPQRHFYLAVDRLQFKMETLLGLLGMAGRRPCLPMVVCCSSRDELDTICSNLSTLSSYISISLLYSDLSEVDRAEVLEKFRQATTRWNRLGRGEEGERDAENDEERKSYVVVVTDACLPLLGSVESPLCACMLINYELPTKKDEVPINFNVLHRSILLYGLKYKKCWSLLDFSNIRGPSILKSSKLVLVIFVHSVGAIEIYMRRMAACMSADGIVISMVVGGEVVILKNLEENSGLVIAEMPINIFEMI